MARPPAAGGFASSADRGQIGLRRIFRSALGAKDQEIAHLAALGMEQHGPTIAAQVVNRSIWAGRERTKGPIEGAGNDLPIHLHILRPFRPTRALSRAFWAIGLKLLDLRIRQIRSPPSEAGHSGVP